MRKAKSQLRPAPHPQKLFISFNSKDRRKAEWIAWTLRRGGHEIAFHAWEVPAGGDIPTWMNARLAWAERLLAVLSPDYVGAVYSVAEWTSKVWDDPSGEKGSVVPVLVRTTPNIPPLLGRLRRIDLTGIGEEEAADRLLRGIEMPHVPSTKPAFDPSPPSVSEHGPTSRPPFAVPEASNYAGGPLGVVMDSSAAAAQALGQLGRQLSSDEEVRRLEGSVQRDELKRVIRDLMFIELNQAPLPWLLRGYAQSENPKNWSQVVGVIGMNAPVVDRLRALLEHFDGSLIYRDTETYRALSRLVHARSGLYDQLRRMNGPTSEDDKALLLAIADNFDDLIAGIKVVQARVARYLAEEYSE